jgi:hypothetical protein
MKLWKIAPGKLENPTYGHENGWRIRRQVRDWSLRGFPRGALGATEATAPKIWWEISLLNVRSSRASSVHDALTLREARAWCDENTPASVKAARQ